MIKKTLYFGNPAYLFSKHNQLIINFNKDQLELEFIDLSADSETDNSKYEKRKDGSRTIPIEDIGVIILDHYGIVLSHYLINALLENNIAVVFCNNSHMPSGLLLNLDSNSLQSEKFKAQINASVPLKKQLWQQTIQAKIRNQAEFLNRKGKNVKIMLNWANDVKSGDSANHEATAAQHYWKNMFPNRLDFYRSRTGPNPNNLLNYGYAVLRAITARSLSGSGLLPTLGIFHRNKYNAYCLADDIMEPYRPFVDAIVCNLSNDGEDYEELTTIVKKNILELPVADVFINGEKSPLMVAMQRTTSSLARCFVGESKKILYPEFIPQK
ncbi:type II CRISPR-associated endonuclease Cas1 [soil metagenome]